MHLLATAARGTADLVAAECRELGLRVVETRSDGVVIDCEPEDAAKALVRLRVATRLLLLLCEVRSGDADELYAAISALHWPDWLDGRHTISVHCTGALPGSPEAPRPAKRPPRDSKPIKNHVFAAQRVKDAVCDRLRKRYGERPSVDLDDPDVHVVVRFAGDVASVALDLCGEPLHRRGYRVAEAEAPLKETLAAAMAMESGWDGTRPLLDPMCGSGTLLIEAVLAVLGVAPSGRRDFAVERWPWHGAALGALLDVERDRAIAEGDAAIEAARRDGHLDVLGLDFDRGAVRIARIQVERAGLAGIIRLERGDARRLEPPPRGTVVLCNPPYGVRIGGRETEELYRELGATMATWTEVDAFLVDGHAEFAEAFGLPSVSSRPLMNGALPIALRHFRLDLAQMTGT